MAKWRVMADVGMSPVILTEQSTRELAVDWLQELSKVSGLIWIQVSDRFYPFHMIRHFDVAEVKDGEK